MVTRRLKLIMATRKRGDILEGEDRRLKAARHYIVFYDGLDESYFIGAMITHKQLPQNVGMSINHFVANDEDGKPYKVSYDNTLLVVAKLIKFEIWGAFTKVGELTQEGVDFVEKSIDHLPPETWSNYYRRTRRSFN